MRIITGIQNYYTKLQIVLDRKYRCMDGVYKTVREQMNELLGEGQIQIPDDQIYIELCFNDERFHNYTGKEKDNDNITLDLKPDDFAIINRNDRALVHISVRDFEYIEYGRENEERHIAANPYYFLAKLTNEIKNQLEERGKLIDLMEADEKFDYSSSETAQSNPGERYGNIVQNDYYVLRHALAYTLVYYRMFRSLLKRLFSDRPIRLHILSIGCGSKTDALGLRRALQHCANKVTATKYVGIDPGKWNQSKYFLYLNDDDEYIRLQDPGEVDRTYVEQEIDYINSQKYRKALEQFKNDGRGQDSIYLILFPNSISEISTNDLFDILNSIRSSYEGKKLYLCLSRNVNTMENPIDAAQVNVIKDFLHNSQPIINCERGREDGDERTEEEINDERSEALGIKIDEGKKVCGKIWEQLKIYNDVDDQMEKAIILKALDMCSEQEREEKKIYIKNYIDSEKEKHQNSIYQPQLLKKPITDINKYDYYQVYEVPEQ